MVNDVQVMPGGLAGMGVKVIYGREFSALDNEKSPPAAVISESLARKYWPDGKVQLANASVLETRKILVGIQ